MQVKIHFETLGCKLNQVESEGAARFFSDAGFGISMEPLTSSSKIMEDAVLCVVNTCTVTTKAEQKARRIIRMLLKVCPNACVLVTGCYAELGKKQILEISPRICVLKGQVKGLLAEVPSKLISLLSRYENNSEDNKSKSESLASSLQLFLDEKSSSSEKNFFDNHFKLVTDSFVNHSRASLKIQDGCNCVCTYCAIRLARGKAVSLPVAEVLNRVKGLEEAGQSEVVITTVNISHYLSEYDGKKIRFAELLELILANTSKIRIRISSLYPEIVDENLGKIISHERVCPHFHISVQSGSDDVLARMKRPYKIEAVYRACEILKKYKNNPFLACDIIAGFPGETDKDFDETMKMLEECGFTFVHAFPFSPRPGTEAYKMRPMVPNYITDTRVKRLEEFNKKSKSAYVESFAGLVLPAVCETVHRARILQDKITVHAVTENFLHCQLNFAPDSVNLPKPGTVVNVKIRRKIENGGDFDVLAELAELLSAD